jgi:hypothetical protein
MSSKKNRQYAVMWDCHGLEAVEEIPDQSLTTFALLQNKKPPVPPNILHWQLRARYNSQRHYEIYIVNTEPSINRDDLVDLFDTDPQNAADTIRRIGHCFYSDRAREDQIKIR